MGNPVTCEIPSEDWKKASMEEALEFIFTTRRGGGHDALH